MEDKVLSAQFIARHKHQDAPPLDKIFVHDLVLDCEIGVFHDEKGVTQRVRFNVGLDVRPHAAHLGDDIDQVISYDIIVDGIKAILAQGHINLVETLAERIAEHCLKEPRAVRAHIRVEKLDKEPGSVGVEIVRQSHSSQPVNVYQLYTEPQD